MTRDWTRLLPWRWRRVWMSPRTLPATLLLTVLGICLLLARPGSAQEPARPGAAQTASPPPAPLVCGIDQSEAEYSLEEDHGPRVAFDRDLCRAVGVALHGKAAAISFKGYPDEETALHALRTGEVDLVPTVSRSFAHVADTRFDLSSPVLFDGVGLLTPAARGVRTLQQLAGRKVCFLAETEVELTLRDAFAGRHVDLLPFPFQEEGEMEAAYSTGECAAVAADLTRLAVIRSAFGEQAGEQRLLEETLSVDPMAMATRRDDARLGRVAEWTLQILLGAAAERVSRPAVETHRRQRLLGNTGEYGTALGLSDTWTRDVLETTGDYLQMFDRDLGANSPLQLPPGLNGLCGRGGAMCATELK